jgi:hypothetical protein
MGRINMIGRGIGVLGDVLTMGLGGNVRRGQPDRVSPMLYQQYQALMDKQKADQDAFRYRNYQNERANLGMGITEERRKEAAKLQSDGWAAQQSMAKAKSDQEWQKYLLGLSQKERAIAESNRHNRTSERLAAGNQAISMDRNDIAREKASGVTKKLFTQVNINGQDVSLSQGQHRAILEEATKSGVFTKDDLSAMMEPYVNNPLEGQKNIVQRYLTWKNNDEKQKQASSAYSGIMLKNKGVVTPGTGNQNVPANTAPAPAVKKPSYSTGGYY